MKILGIETSCDETACAIVQKDPNSKAITLLSSTISTSLGLHAKTGGIIPEVAARQQTNYIIPVITKALLDAKTNLEDIDAIAVTYGPGLIGSLLVGVETAKTISLLFNKPLIPINHLFGHIYANFIGNTSDISFPALGLIVSGAHTDLVVIKNHNDWNWIGGTRDDAAGEAFDKIGRLLGLPYPAGPAISELAKKGDPKAYRFPRPLIGSPDFDFSFSGLKTAVLREVQTHNGNALNESTIEDICASTQYAIVDVLVKKTMKAAKKYNTKSILLGGGVAANEMLKQKLQEKISQETFDAKLSVPPKDLCTDNAAMIATTAFYNFKPVDWSKVTADPELYFD